MAMRIVYFIIISFYFFGHVACAETVDKNGTLRISSSIFFEQVLINENTLAEQIDFFNQKVDATFLEFKKKQSKYKSQQDFLEYVFYKVHKKYLKKYEAYQNFNSLFSQGIYGCLTGTALYAVLLDKLDFEYEIIETNYHIYLVVATDQGKVLMESTDAFTGFVSGPEQIDQRINSSLENQNSEDDDQLFELNIFNAVSLNELIGLQYYNQAVNAYNSKKIEESLYQLNEAAKYYSSHRIVDFLKVINMTLNNSIDTHIKEYDLLNSLVIN